MDDVSSQPEGDPIINEFPISFIYKLGRKWFGLEPVYFSCGLGRMRCVCQPSNLSLLDARTRYGQFINVGGNWSCQVNHYIALWGKLLSLWNWSRHTTSLTTMMRLFIILPTLTHRKQDFGNSKHTWNWFVIDSRHTCLASWQSEVWAIFDCGLIALFYGFHT